MQSLEGKYALVTGGSRGIGAEIAKALAADGAFVAINFASSEDRANAVVSEIEKTGGRAITLRGDVSNQDDVEAMFNSIDERFDKRLDILVNNAGIFEMAPLQESSLEDFDRTMQINVRGVFDVTRHAVDRITDGGRIITIGSCMADRGMFPGSAIYNMSKAAVAGLTRGWAHDLGERRITVNCVQPGPIDTELNPDIEENPAAGMIKGMTTLKRYGTAEEVASLVRFLASPASAYVSGQTINIDGGLNA